MELLANEISLLLVEDEEMARTTMVDMISRRYPGLHVTSAENGAAGLSRFQAGNFDIVVTDINMPALNGIEMIREIRSLTPETPVIVLTAVKDTSFVLDAINLGVRNYVLKPIDHQLLFSAIDDCVTRIRQRRQIEAFNRIITSHAHELEVLNTKLTTANSDLEAFNFMASHDLRQPLHKISLYCQVLLDTNGNKLDEETRRHLQGIAGSVEQMDGLIDTLLDFSRVSHRELKREQVDLSKLASEIAAGLALQQPARQVTFEIEDGTKAEGDCELLKVVLGNLLGNAWKYTRKKERAHIQFKRGLRDGKPVFYVRDNGVGFDGSHSGELFNPFHRQHDRAEYEGHGIGLFTVQRIVQRHGGRAWAEGTPNEGATVFFSLAS